MGYFHETTIEGDPAVIFDVAALFAATGREASFSGICLIVHKDSALSFVVCSGSSASRAMFPWAGGNYLAPDCEDARSLPNPTPTLSWAAPGRSARNNLLLLSPLAGAFIRPALVADDGDGPHDVGRTGDQEKSGGRKPRRFKSWEVAQMVQERMTERFAMRWWNALWRRALPHIDPLILRETRRFSQNLIYHNLRLRHKAFGQLVTTCPAAALLLTRLFERNHVRPDIGCFHAQTQAELFEEFAGVYLRMPLPTLIESLVRLYLFGGLDEGAHVASLPDVAPVKLSRCQIEFVRRVPPYAAAGWDCENVWRMVHHWPGDLDLCHLRQLRGLSQWKGLRALCSHPTLAAVYLRNPDRALKTLRQANLRGEQCRNSLRKWYILMRQVEDYLRRPDADPARERTMSLETLVNRSEEWHHAVMPYADHYNRFAFPINEPFPASWIPDFEKDDLRFVFLTDAAALQDESQRMQHCVWSYAERVHLGQCQIYSVRDQNGQSVATIELTPHLTVAQAQGKCNQPLPGAIQNFIREAVTAGQQANAVRPDQSAGRFTQLWQRNDLAQYVRDLPPVMLQAVLPMPALAEVGPQATGQRFANHFDDFADPFDE